MKDGKQGEVVAVALPGCLLAVLSAIALALAAFGRHPMWPHEAVNLAEAAGVREEAEVARLIEHGHDPNARYPVRPGVLFERAVNLTPLEAAVLNNDAAIVSQLFARGVAPDASSWVALRCFAADLRVGPVLDAHRPAGASLDCSAVKTPWN